VAVLACFGVDKFFGSKGIGKRWLATALQNCHDASERFAFIAVSLDYIDEAAKQFYQKVDLDQLPGYPMRLHLSYQKLKKLMKA